MRHGLPFHLFFSHRTEDATNDPVAYWLWSHQNPKHQNGKYSSYPIATPATPTCYPCHIRVVASLACVRTHSPSQPSTPPEKDPGPGHAARSRARVGCHGPRWRTRCWNETREPVVSDAIYKCYRFMPVRCYGTAKLLNLKYMDRRIR
jgi:hypothetical protein